MQRHGTLRYTAWSVLIVSFAAGALCAQESRAVGPDLHFRITVVDEHAGRGIPLVKLTTLTGVEYYTDSAGVVAFYEPELMDRKVYFNVESHGYEFKKDGFGFPGRTLDVKPGDSAVLKMKRINIAQRLYRITGSGIYHDSVLLGDAVPIRHPFVNAGVMGQDSVIVAPYRDRLFWIWGDTTNARYPLAANFKVTAATSQPPGKGGLDPEIGIELEYFTEGDFVKPMAPLPERKNSIWLDSLFTAKDHSGKPHLLATYSKIQPPLKAIGRGMVEFNDERQVFEPIREDPVDELIPTKGMPFEYVEDETPYLYFFHGALTRSPANYESAVNRDAYEAFTCLREGCRFDGTKEQLDRAADGTLRYTWRKNTSPIGPREQDKLVKAGWIKPSEQWFRLVDIETGKNVMYASGEIAFNPYRKRWTLVACQIFGTSVLGEVWYAEADTPIGPWTYARKIATHEKYSFYNVIQHPDFAKENGRKIFFEGTYTKMFSGNPIPTPRYDYNQIMYSLDLDDPRLALPAPVYHINGFPQYRTGTAVPANITNRELAFYAGDRPASGASPIVAERDKATGGSLLSLRPPHTTPAPGAMVVFYALPANIPAPPALTTFLYEYISTGNGQRIYSTGTQLNDPAYRRTDQPICRVWECPICFNPFDL